MRAVLIASLCILLAACAAPAARHGRSDFRPAAGPAAGYSQTGLASWYGRPFHGRQTASGERYDMNKMTAAHRKLPFGTRVRVTNLANGRSVVLTINDRGPFKRGRIIDVSRRAAGKLGFLKQGLIRVRVEALGKRG